ncbi:hypothetical protein YC2023_042988 [Brassica napus]
MGKLDGDSEASSSLFQGMEVGLGRPIRHHTQIEIVVKLPREYSVNTMTNVSLLIYRGQGNILEHD